MAGDWVEYKSSVTDSRSGRIKYYKDVGLVDSSYEICATTPEDQLKAVMNRITRPVPLPNERSVSWKTLVSTATRFTYMLWGAEMLTRTQVINSYKCARLKKRYFEADNQINLYGCFKKDARIKAFVKVEKFPKGKLLQSAPRLICSRNPKYILELMQFIKPIDKRLRWLQSRYSKYPAIVKGLNQTQRAQRLTDVCWYHDYVIISLDAAKFDAHVSYELLEIEHSVYNGVYDNDRLRELLTWQLINRGGTRDVRFQTYGRRMSGDANTSCGNNLLMFMMLYTIMRRLKIKEYELMIDGDDCLVIIRQRDRELFYNNFRWIFLDFGCEITIGGIHTNYKDVVHCQSHHFLDKMIRSFDAILGKMFISHEHFTQRKHGVKILKTMAQCELALNQGVPIVQPVMVNLLRRLEGIQVLDNTRYEGAKYRAIKEAGSWEKVLAAKAKPISSEARCRFEELFNLTDDEQRRIEENYCGWINATDFGLLCQ